MNFWQVIEKQSIVNKYPSFLEFAKFAVVGVIGTCVDFGVYAILTRVAGFYFLYATAISVFAAIINNFFLNKYWTFRKGRSGRGAQESVRFFIVSIVNYFINIGITFFIVKGTHLESMLGSYEDFFAKVVAIAIVLFSNYFGNKWWTFKD